MGKKNFVKRISFGKKKRKMLQKEYLLERLKTSCSLLTCKGFVLSASLQFFSLLCPKKVVCVSEKPFVTGSFLCMKTECIYVHSVLGEILGNSMQPFELFSEQDVYLLVAGLMFSSSFFYYCCCMPAQHTCLLGLVGQL